MNWLPPSVIATLCGTLVLVAVYGFLYRQYRTAYLALWTWSWLFYALRLAFMLSIVLYHQTALLLLGNQLSTLLSGTLLLWGTYRFMEKPFSKWWWYGTLIGAAWIILTTLVNAPFLILTLPTFTFLAFIYFWTGVIFLQADHLTGAGRPITGWTFVLWGVHKADYPVLRPVIWFAPWGYLLAALFELISAISILLVYFDKMRLDLITSQERLTAFADALPDLGLVMDHRGVYLEIITAQDNLLYREADQLKDRRMHDMLPQAVADLLLRAVGDTIASGTTQVVEYILDVPAGQRWFEARSALMRAEPDGGGEVVLIARDITQRVNDKKALEAAAEHLALLHQQVQDHADQLESRVAARTAELYAANEHLQRLSRAKDDFVSNVSHELRTPITSLKLRHHLIAQKPEQIGEYLPVLVRETERLEPTIENLLALSRLDQDQTQMDIQPVDLNALADVYTQDRAPLTAENQLALQLCCQPDLPLVMADGNLLGQTIDILLSNAINYTPPGESITVSTHIRPDAGQVWVGLSVRDTGLGISPRDQGLLFERFFRGAAAHQSKASGTGLGLAIAKAIIDRHGGQIDVFSTGVQGEGTTFTIWLPTNTHLPPNTRSQDATHDDAKKGGYR